MGLNIYEIIIEKSIKNGNFYIKEQEIINTWE